MTGYRKPLIAASAVAVALAATAVYISREQADRGESDAPVQTTRTSASANIPPANHPEFRKAELLSALSDVCAATAPDDSDRVWTEEEIEAHVDAYNEQKRHLSQNLSTSEDAEHLHLAALLQDDPGPRFELFDRAIARNPSDPFLLWSAVRLCAEAGESMPCPLREWEELLVTLDSQNSESWVRVAANRYAANEHDLALESMQRAATSAESRAYWTEMIEMVERASAAGSDFGFAERAGLAFGIAASEQPRYRDYLRMCEAQSAQSVDWAYACLTYGELVETHGKTELGVSIAQSLQRIALEELGEPVKAAEVQQRVDARRQESLDAIREYNPNIERLILSSPPVFVAHLAAIRSDGEVSARRQIASQIERLLEERPELACEPQ